MSDLRLDDMKKRLHTIALFGKLTSQIRSKSTSLARWGFETLDQQILLCFFTLRFIMEKTLQDEDCFLEDIALFLLEANRDLFHLPLLMDDCRSLALLILSDIIGNSGEPVVFMPFADAPDLRVSLQYVDSRLVSSRAGLPDVSYRMVDDGFHLMLSTLEMEENMRLQFSDLIFQMELKARNYSRALDEIRQIFQLLKIQEAEIEQKQISLRTNAASLSAQQYQKLNEKTLNLMSESRKKFESYRLDVAGRQENLRRILSSKTEEEEIPLQQLTDLGQIESWLSRSILSLEKIINLLMAFSITYDQELKEQLKFTSARRRSFGKEIYQEVLSDPDLLGGFDHLIASLFFSLPESMFSLAHALAYQPLKSAEEDNTFEEISARWDEQAEQERHEKLKQETAMFDRTVSEMLKRLLDAPDHTLSLSKMCEDLMQEANADQFKQLLCGFTSLARLDLQDLQAQAMLMMEEERTFFSLPLSILDVMERIPALHSWSWLVSKKSDQTFSRTFCEDDLALTVTCQDLQFSLLRALPREILSIEE